MFFKTQSKEFGRLKQVVLMSHTKSSNTGSQNTKQDTVTQPYNDNSIPQSHFEFRGISQTDQCFKWILSQWLISQTFQVSFCRNQLFTTYENKWLVNTFETATSNNAYDLFLSPFMLKEITEKFNIILANVYTFLFFPF